MMETMRGELFALYRPCPCNLDEIDALTLKETKQEAISSNRVKSDVTDLGAIGMLKLESDPKINQM